ncbi:MAG: two component transcriptional regulator, LytTR family [Bacteroidetes bacterium]|nr:two component transcriptional regulator, LytTR family [Bacteroidota bacterium]
MKKINCLIVDDEPPALHLIKGYVNKTPFLELKGKCANAFEAMELMNSNSIDLLFLDIQMPDLNGIEFSRTLTNGPKIILTTAFEKYALEGFRIDALDYLLKPFNYEEFLKAANKAKEWFRTKLNPEQKTETDSFLYVKSEYKQIKIDLNKVLFFEGLKDYVKIHLEDADKAVLSLISLKALEEQLPSKFMRVHRSFIINLEKIEAIERTQVIIGKNHIRIADQHKNEFMEYLASKSMKF